LPRVEDKPVPIAMQLRRIIMSEIDDQQHIVLKEIDGDRSFPIVIGLFEASSIDRRVRGVPTPRPLTHDLVASAIDLLGGEIQDVIISELKEHTYFAQLRVRQGGELVVIDCRPSDAIAVAVSQRVPIYVNEDVLGDVLDD
jgi:bifunctional DNase/RNase